jgi:hypothetical protein
MSDTGESSRGKSLMKNLAQCALWKDPETTVAKGLFAQFVLLETFFKDSNWWRYLLKCRGCGQLYVFEFQEQIDWQDRDDTHFTTWIPVGTTEDIEAVSTAVPVDLRSFVPRLCNDMLPGEKQAKCYWVTDATTGDL